MQYLLNKNLLNLILLVISVFSLIFIFLYSKRIQKIDKLMGKKRNEKIKHKNNLFKSLKNNLYKVLLLKNKSSYFNLIYSLLLLLLLVIFVFLLTINNIFLAISIPILIYFFTVKILKELITNFDVIIKRNFSKLANHMIKVFSETDDLSIVLYESSKEIEEPLKSLILTLSREIIVDNTERKLIKFIEETDNLWLHSFIFTLINYKETSSKKDIIENLLMLSELIDEKNDISDKMIADRKPVVIVNYMLLFVGVIIFIGNLILNPIMKSFISTAFGTISLIIGISCIFLTIIINIKFTKQ